MPYQLPASLELLHHRPPLIDVRAPIEFARGAVPGAINLPLMDDDERRRVGERYHRNGNEAAVALGHQLVSGRLRERRLDAWRDFIAAHPGAMLYCARGGQRSAIAQRWLAEAGSEVARLQGGYKSARQTLMQATEQAARAPMVVVSGLTGCAKTRLLLALEHGVDLEGHARHKGSSFGRQPVETPTQIDFEHQLALDLAERPTPFVLEDESRSIGAVEIPLPLWEAMKPAPRVRVEMPLDWRIEQIRRDYIDDLWVRYRDHYGEWLGWTLMRRQLVSALVRLRKRLGQDRLDRLLNRQQHAFAQHRRSGDSRAHHGWLAPLLQEYYDPLYHHQLARSGQQALFVGDWQACLEFVADYCQRHHGEPILAQSVAP
ncbi:tRNA 2-selenouridine synthase [Kushneria sinocarnis]|uniref:tRNA 2-selenouridine synthase n=1 Tax=Kushneria sinocarnis TaxID=595502 RepID=A0A420WTB0_9GAMM|nr:tRNA 2-selenouridine(34) synthase MnmH [Kushneria sinocarnis]RKQ95751.1 tRNA 2-selenouridine synthase [Kushneria sinocarnis]